MKLLKLFIVLFFLINSRTVAQVNSGFTKAELKILVGKMKEQGIDSAFFKSLEKTYHYLDDSIGAFKVYFAKPIDGFKHYDFNSSSILDQIKLDTSSYAIYFFKMSNNKEEIFGTSFYRKGKYENFGMAYKNDNEDLLFPYLDIIKKDDNVILLGISWINNTYFVIIGGNLYALDKGVLCNSNNFLKSRYSIEALRNLYSR